MGRCLKSCVRRAPPEISLRAISFDCHALENLARAHVEELNVDARMLLLVTRDEISQQVLSMRRVDQQMLAAATAATTRKQKRSNENCENKQNQLEAHRSHASTVARIVAAVL